MRSNLPDPMIFVGQTVPQRQDIKIIELVESGNDGHLFRAYSSVLQRSLACKLIPEANLIHGPDNEPRWQAEVHKADVLRNPAVVKFESILDWKTRECDCVALISEFVEGPNLRKFARHSSDEVTIPFIVNLLSVLLNLLHEMKERRISHGDLHAGNILVEDRSSYDLLGPRFVFRVTDFGVADASSDQRFKDDYLQVADVIKLLLREIEYTEVSPRDKFTFIALRDEFVGRSLVEHDTTRDPLARQPRELLQRLRNLNQEFEISISVGPDKLTTPFDFLSCEQIGDAPAILDALYSDQFLGPSMIESRNNVVVTGPRGCGKSTVFKALSLDHLAHVSKATPDHTRYIGVYYRCDDLYFAFPRYSTPSREEAINIPVHFVTATLIARLLQSMAAWGTTFFSQEVQESEASLCKEVWSILGISPPQTPSGLTFASLINRLHKERLKAAERQRFAHDANRTIGMCFGPETVEAVCTALQSLTFLRARPAYFFIDDFSSPKVTADLQASLNRVFMHRSSACFFKVSTESTVSFLPNDIDGKRYVENREFILHNLGLVYLHADQKTKAEFIEDVFHRRLASTPGFPVADLEDLIGTDEKLTHNELARRIRNGDKLQAWGRRTLTDLCSGDIHYVISLVGDMVRLQGGWDALRSSGKRPKIPPDIQNRAIRDAAGTFLKNLRGIPKVGQRLVEIVEAFGNIAHSHLKFVDSKNEERSPPKQATRIEPYEPLSLGVEGRQLYDELLRYSVFLEDFRGKSRRGHVIPRLYLRRFLIPHFNLTFSKRDSIELEPEEFELFLLDPAALARKKTARQPGSDGERQPHLNFGRENE